MRVLLAVLAASSTAAADPTCALRWDELDASRPAKIELRAWDSTQIDECPDGFSPHPKRCVAPDCVRSGDRVVIVDGPHGSGRFEALGFAVGSRYYCTLASTVGWRSLSPAAQRALSPIPWTFDGLLVVWSRLSFGDSEMANALAPVVYRVDGTSLVRDDARGAKLAHRVAEAYRDSSIECRGAVIDALEHWGR